MITYLLIFIAKIIENALATLRLILVANDKKKSGAILQGIVSLIWIFSTGIVIINIDKIAIKIIVFCIGSTLGSYIGCILEEKIAMGTDIIICITKNKHKYLINNELKKFKIYTFNNKNKCVLIIILKRKYTNNIKKIIMKIDNTAILMAEKIKLLT